MGTFWELRLTRKIGTKVRSKTLVSGYHDDYDTALKQARNELEQWKAPGRLSVWLSLEDWDKLQ